MNIRINHKTKRKKYNNTNKNTKKKTKERKQTDDKSPRTHKYINA